MSSSVQLQVLRSPCVVIGLVSIFVDIFHGSRIYSDSLICSSHGAFDVKSVQVKSKYTTTQKNVLITMLLQTIYSFPCEALATTCMQHDSLIFDIM